VTLVRELERGVASVRPVVPRRRVGIGDKGYDSDAVVERVRAVGARVVIPTQKNRTVQRDTDWHRYKDRNLVERFWAKAKQYRRVATVREDRRQLLGLRVRSRRYDPVAGELLSTCPRLG